VRRLQITARTAGNARASVAAVREQLRAIGGVDVGSVWALSNAQKAARAEVLSSTLPMAPLIVTGMVLAGMGVYGILAFAVARRARELAIRVALGATRRDIGRMVALHGARLAAAGALAGVGLSWALTRVAQGMGGIFDGPGWQAFAAPLLVLAALATIAAWLPARRAMRTDPALLLREE
jgi:putative ABC transport system permease protein